MPSKGNKPRTAVLGAGRLGAALTRALRAAGYPAVVVPQSPAGWSRARALHLPTLRWLPIDGEIFFFCVPDSKIRSLCEIVASEGRVFKGRLYVHCAGALGLDVLAPAARNGGHVGSLHPFVSVPSPKSELAGAYAAVDGDAHTRRALAAVARHLGMHPFVVRRGERAAYHAAGALASNGLVALAYAAQRTLVRAGLPRAQALHAIVPLMLSAMRALSGQSLPHALTGPVARNDEAVVSFHLAALKRDVQVLAAYKSLSAVAVGLARQMSGADLAALRRIEKLLSR